MFWFGYREKKSEDGPQDPKADPERRFTTS
jgi:hypothetical protein